VGWPKDTSPSENFQSLTKAEPATAKDAQSKLTAAKSDPQPDTPDDPITQKYGLGHVNIWIGTIAQQIHPEKSPQSKTMPTHMDDTWQLDPDDGIMLIYLPFLPNEKCPGVVPETTEYMSTWNFEYTPQQVDNVVMLAERNFEVGRERIRRAVRAMWNKKRQTRMEREEEGVWDKEKGLMKDAFKELQN
jgi:cytosolic phospholipase A2